MTDPLKHTTAEHAGSEPVYSPYCEVCIDMFEQMLQAYYRRIETRKETSNE